MSTTLPNDDELLAVLAAGTAAKPEPAPASAAAAMSDDDLSARLAMMPHDPADPAPQQNENELSAGDVWKHVGQSAAQAGIDFVDMPANVEQLVNIPIKGAENFVRPRLGMDRFEGEYQTLIPKPSDYLPEAAKEFMDTEYVTKEQSPGVHALGKAIEWGGLAPVNAGRALLKEGVKKAPKMLPQALRAAKPDVYAGAGAAAGDFLAGYLDDSDSPYAEMVGGLTGAVLGARRAPGDLIRRSANRLTKAGRLANNKPSRAAQDRAYRAIMHNADNPADLKLKVAHARTTGEVGTMADITGDQNIFNLEAAVRSDTSTAGDFADVAQKRANQQVAKLDAPFGVANADEAAEAAAASVTAQKGQINANKIAAEAAADAQLKAAEDAAELAGNKVRPKPGMERVDQSSGALKQTVDKQAAAHRKVSDEAWSLFKEQPPVDAAPLRELVQDLYDGLTPPQQRRIRKLAKAGGYFDDIGLKLTDPLDEVAESVDGVLAEVAEEAPEIASIRPEDLQDMLHDLKEAGNAAAIAGGADTGHRILAEMTAALDDALTTKGSSSYNPYFAGAKKSTEDWYKMYRPEKMGDLYNSPPELYSTSLGFEGPRGAQTMRLLIEEAKLPDGVGKVEDVLRSLARSEGLDPKFVRKYEAVLDALPEEVANQFFEAADKADSVTGLTKSTKAAKEAAGREAKGLTKTLDDMVLAKYGENADNTLHTALSGRVKGPQLTELKNAMDRAGRGPEFKRHVGDWLEQNLYTDAGGIRKIDKASRGRFKKSQARLVESGLITQAQADFTMEVLDTNVQNLSRRKNAIQKHMLRGGSEYESLVASALAATVLAGTPGTQSLLVGGALRRMFKRVISNSNGRPEVQALEEFLINPNKFLDFASSVKNVDEAMQHISTKINVRAQALASLQEGREEDE